jgi:hypothetical protein
MIPHRKTVLMGVLALLLLPLLSAQNKDKEKAAKPPKLTPETRTLIIRNFQAELPFARRYFPMGKVGLQIDATGKITPSEGEVRQMVADYGPAAKPGDRVRITNVFFKGSNIVFEINGGPVKRKKWYQRLEVGSVGGVTTPGGGDPTVVDTNARGSYVVLAFKDYIPELTGNQIRAMLKPVLDFNSMSAAEAYAKAMPPIVQKAIKDHKALVGMDRDMVLASMGRPPKKYRDHDGQTDYEEWIYGEPPEEVNFVRFVGDRVVRIETMKVDGQKVVRTAKEVDLDQGAQTLAQKNDSEDQSDQKAPSLLRPGEQPVNSQPGARNDPNKTPPPGGPPPNTPPGMPDPSQMPAPNPGGMPPGPGGMPPTPNTPGMPPG